MNQAKPAIRNDSPDTGSALEKDSPNVPAGWRDVQCRLARDAGLAMLLVEGAQPPALVVSNNNSICRAIQASPEHVRLCDPYCGAAHSRVVAANDAIHYQCHAGLYCFAAPVQIGKRELAVIGGRAFLGASDYRAAVDRFS